jgi:uroporphyrinogen decarboxylase
MKNRLSSKDRLLAAINNEEADRVPLTFRDTQLPENYTVPSSNQFEAVDIFLKLGIDPMLYLHPDNAWKFNADVKINIRKENVTGEKYPLLSKEYRTPRGVLKQVVRQTPDWPDGDNVPLWSDFMVPKSRSVKYLIENMDDVECFSNLFDEPTERDLENFGEKAERYKRFAEERGVLINGSMTISLGDIAAWSCGIDNLILWSFRKPALLHKLLDVILEWNLKYVQQILETGAADSITCRGYYENMDIWSPRLYKTFFAPRLRKMIELVHKGGAKFCYHNTTGIMPALEIFRDIGVDILYGPEPVEGNVDLQETKDRVGEEICLWGGMNAPVTLGIGTPEEIEKGVREAVQALAPGGGFILSAMESIILGHDPKICGLIPWESVECMIEAWRKVCDYPV